MDFFREMFGVEMSFFVLVINIILKWYDDVILRMFFLVVIELLIYMRFKRLLCLIIFKLVILN